MNYDNYPSHCNFPDSDWENFHKNHIPNWNSLLNELKGKKDTVGIEIGSFCGGSAVWCLESNRDQSDFIVFNPSQCDVIKQCFWGIAQP